MITHQQNRQARFAQKGDAEIKASLPFSFGLRADGVLEHLAVVRDHGPPQSRNPIPRSWSDTLPTPGYGVA